MPVLGAVPGMNKRSEPDREVSEERRTAKDEPRRGRFRQQPDAKPGPRADAAPHKPQIDKPQNRESHPDGKDSDSRDHLRRDAEASARILRRLMPKRSEEPSGPSAAEAIKTAEAGKRVLLADDDPMMRNSVRLTLEQAGYTVVCSETGEEAWQAFSQMPGSFDLLISDISMPELDGASLAHRIRLLRPHMRIILVSGYFDEKAAGDLMKDGKVKFIAKPFGLDVLLDEVRKALKSA